MKRFLPAFVFAFALPAVAAAQDDHSDEAAEQLTIETAPFTSAVDIQCTFKTECFETEKCSETEFLPSLSGNAGGLSATEMVVEAELISDAETTTMLGVLSSDVYALSGGTFDARHFMTIAADGAARYTIHLSDGPMAITYHGTCEDQT